MAKKSEKSQRQAVIDQMRKEQQRKERMRGIGILGVAAVIVIGLLAAAVIPYVKEQRRQDRVAGTPIDNIGVAESAASCDDVITQDASGSGQHVDPGTPIKYPDAPPAFGKHWGNFLYGPEIRNFYTTSDRPQVERLVHSLEHGHTILWYDATVKPGTADYKAVKSIAEKFKSEDYFMAAPWEATDGAAFPKGKHVVLTHWTGPTKQKGVWQYCGRPSGAVIKSFVTKYDKMNAPEPGAA